MRNTLQIPPRCSLLNLIYTQNLIEQCIKSIGRQKKKIAKIVSNTFLKKNLN